VVEMATSTNKVKVVEYKPTGAFFALNSEALVHQAKTTRRSVLNLINADAKRGVRRLSDEAYCRHYGSTRDSLIFLLIVSSEMSCEAVRAELTHSAKQHFTLKVHLKTGYTLVFKGVAGGYFGEGSRGCYDILKFCGFNEKQCQKVWTNETFTCSRRIV
jgi:hypothetical protein